MKLFYFGSASMFFVLVINLKFLIMKKVVCLFEILQGFGFKRYLITEQKISGKMFSRYCYFHSQVPYLIQLAIGLDQCIVMSIGFVKPEDFNPFNTNDYPFSVDFGIVSEYQFEIIMHSLLGAFKVPDFEWLKSVNRDGMRIGLN